MKTLIDKINIKKVLIVFLLIQPIIDLITSINVRFYDSFTTVGVVVKGIFLAFLTLYIFIKYNFKNRKSATIFIGLIIIYEILYLIFNYYSKSSISFYSEFKYSIKAIFAPIILVDLYTIFKYEKFNIKSRYISYLLLEYVILILIANISGTAFNTYYYDNTGLMGWFYAGNDISAILVSLFPILYFYCVKNYNFKIILLMLLSIYITLFIGTKVSFVDIILSILSFVILPLLNYFYRKNELKLFKNLILSFVLLLYLCLIIPFSPFFVNIKFQFQRIVEENEIREQAHKEKKEVLDSVIFNGRTKFQSNTSIRYRDASILSNILGLGYVDYNNVEYKLVERDHYDLFYNHGIIGTIVILIPYVYIFVGILIQIIKNRIRNVLNMHISSYFISLALFLGISFYAGHILLNPTVNLYLDIVICNLYYRLYKKDVKVKIRNNKVTIMALHLKPGGIEKFIQTTSEFLSKNYDVEVVCVYHYPSNEVIKLDKRVKVKYLLKEKYLPNKHLIKELVSEKKFLKLIIELFKSIKIILLKKIKMINYIKKCDSGIIISTRPEHNYIMSEYSMENTLKIATEHNYHSSFYSNRVVNSCSDVDLFIVSTKDQEEYYKNKFNGTNINVFMIPFGLNNNFLEVSKLDKKYIISVGRLSKEKGFLDLIDIFNLIHKKESNIKLKIIGYGEEEENIRKRIDDLNLNSSVILLGKKSSEEVKKEMLNSTMYLMTSYTESFGIVLIEAMSCGVPCIIFDSAKGALELIKDGYNGYIIENRDNKRYAEVVLNTLKDKNKLKELGKNSKEYSKQFNINNVEELWLKVLKEYL